MMEAIFRRHELPVAYTMIAAADRVKPRRDGRHPYDKFYYLWAAFNEIFKTIVKYKKLNQEGYDPAHIQQAAQFMVCSPIKMVFFLILNYLSSPFHRTKNTNSNSLTSKWAMPTNLSFWNI